jgi:RNA polymerase sigma-70 factor (ECF subfamily)
MEYGRFAPLVSQHTELIARVAAALVGVQEADDVAQEALMRAWQGWPTLRDAESTRPWLMQITYNVCRTWQSRRKGLRLSAEDRLDALETLGATQAALGASDHVTALDLRQALTTLDDESRQIVLLRFYAGLDSYAIGEMLDMAPATVRGRLRRALQRLRNELNEDDRHPAPNGASAKKEA